MSEITDFFEGGVDRNNRTLVQMQNYSDSQHESSHNHIQWMFPLHEKSYHAMYSPILTKEDIEYIRNSSVIKENMTTNLNVFKSFLGISPKSENKIRLWCQNGNHNLLRITRIIRSLRLFGLENEAKQFYDSVINLANRLKLNYITKEYWNQAINDNLEKSMTEKFLNQIRIDL